MARLEGTAARIGWPSLAAGLVMLFAVGTWSLREPGLFYDEAFDAIPALQVLQGEPAECSETVRIWGRTLPLMMHPHIGATSAYTALAAFAIAGPSVESLRVSQLAVGALALILLFLLARAWFGDATAGIAVLLCGSAPAFIWWSRGGANWTVPLLPLALGMLLALTRWWRGGGPWALALAALLCGFGITTKLLFVWLLLPLALTAALTPGVREIVAKVRGASRGALLGTLLAFTVGLAPLIAHNVPKPETLRHVLRSSVTTAWGHNNRAFLANLRYVVARFLEMLNGEVVMTAPVQSLGIGGAAFVLALVYGALRVAWSARHRRARGAEPEPGEDFPARLLLVLVPLTVLPQSTVTTSALGATYLFLIVPLTWLLVALPAGDLLALAGSPSLTRLRRAPCVAAAAGLTLVLVASHLWTNVALLRFFAATGGHGHWSDAIYRVAETLERDFAGRRVVALDWGFARSIELLTERRVRVVEGHEFLPAPTERYAERARELLAVPGAVFLVHDESFATCPRCFDRFAQVAGEEGRELVLVGEVRHRDVQPHTRIYEVGPPRTVGGGAGASP